MGKATIVAQFREYSAAHSALCGLLQSGVLPNDINIIVGHRSYRHGANRDFGMILDEDTRHFLAAVRQGKTLLAVDAWERERARIMEIIEHHAPIEIAERDADLIAAGVAGERPPSRLQGCRPVPTNRPLEHFQNESP